MQSYTLVLCLAVLAVVMLVNLRGTKESGLAFGVPTYVFILGLGGILALGVWKALAGQPPVVPPPALQAATGGAGLWLLLRAFAAGCTAMTGVEAVSNGVGAFREPRVRNAHGTLTAIVVVLGLLLAGIAYLCTAYRIEAMDQTQPGYQSVGLPAGGGGVRPRLAVLRSDRQRAGRAVPVGQHLLRRVPAAVPAGGVRRLPAERVRGARAAAGVHGGHPVPHRRRPGCCSRCSAASPTG